MQILIYMHKEIIIKKTEREKKNNIGLKKKKTEKCRQTECNFELNKLKNRKKNITQILTHIRTLIKYDFHTTLYIIVRVHSSAKI